jgi:cytochrome c553
MWALIFALYLWKGTTFAHIYPAWVLHISGAERYRQPKFSGKVDEIMKINQLKKLALVLIILPLFGVSLLNSIAPAQAGTANQDLDAAAFFKAKCAMCHGAKAEKKFDTSLPDEQLVEIVLKGKKAEKPPNMPEYETKGVTADQAKALVAHMKQLKANASE